jgi:hypothetical protein
MFITIWCAVCCWVDLCLLYWTVVSRCTKLSLSFGLFIRVLVLRDLNQILSVIIKPFNVIKKCWWDEIFRTCPDRAWAHPASWTMGTGSFPGVKRSGRGADHPPSPSTEVENEKSYTSSSPLSPWWSVVGWNFNLQIPNRNTWCYYSHHLKEECLQCHILTTTSKLPSECALNRQKTVPGQTNYDRSMRQPFPSNAGLRFSREKAVVTLGPFQMLRSLCVIDTNVTILRHFLLKLRSNEILR